MWSAPLGSQDKLPHGNHGGSQPSPLPQECDLYSWRVPDFQKLLSVCSYRLLVRAFRYGVMIE
jgi:hypothetical protein